MVSAGATIASANASEKKSSSKSSSAKTAATTVITNGMGPNDFGMTLGDTRGFGVHFTYTHGFFCDTKVAALSTTRCEVGAAATMVPPGARRIGTLFIAVPLGFSVPALHCPNGLTCVDHPMTVDMTRLAAALAPVFKTSAAKLLPMLQNFPTPGHDHFIASRNDGRPQWWNVAVIGVTSPAIYLAIVHARTLVFIQALLATKTPGVLGPIPTNIFLFFAASSS
ncbi:MAG TPA: hypothetical protein VJT31_15815 [Rugosimonospora sp.]|nr:hypothetical protein [Rugosimonospora sp.]